MQTWNRKKLLTRPFPGNGTVNQGSGSVILDGNLPFVPFERISIFCGILSTVLAKSSQAQVREFADVGLALGELRRLKRSWAQALPPVCLVVAYPRVPTLNHNLT